MDAQKVMVRESSPAIYNTYKNVVFRLKGMKNEDPNKTYSCRNEFLQDLIILDLA